MAQSGTSASLVGDPLEGGRLRVVVATIAINVAAVGLLVFAPWSNWRSAVALNGIDNLLLLGFIVRRRDGLLARLVVFGLVTGFAELAADAWEVVAVQFGYLGLLLRERFGGWGLMAIGLLGAVNIPYYEEMARRIHWWRYSGCRMISGTPYYIIAGELLIAVAFALLVKNFRRAGAAKAALTGVAGGAAIFASYAIGYGLTDGVFPR